MLFTRIEFWLLFLPVLAGAHVLSRRLRNALLLVASYVFYGAWDWRFLGLLLFSTCLDYVLGKFASDNHSPSTRLRAVWASVSVNLGLLAVFKYFDFFLDSLATIIGSSALDSWHLDIVLPVGLSFYTFQTMSYCIDIYRGQAKASDSFIDFALYVSFFPQLVAGPIERASTLLPQIQHSSPPRSPRQLEEFVHLIAWGLCKKVVIADALANVVDITYGNPSATGPEIYLATVAFAYQIYCDFSGYTDIARGLAGLLGFDLMLNFNLPYFARNPSDLWRRWHISLSTWIRDYLYIPLGGRSDSKWRSTFNLLCAMGLSGLWHGAAINYLIWGLYHGLIIIAYHALRGWLRRHKPTWKVPTLLSIVLMFHIWLLGMALFRASAPELATLVSRFAVGWSQWHSPWSLIQYMWPLLVPFFLFELAQYRTNDLTLYMRGPWVCRVLFFSFCVATTLLLGRGGGQPFVYFQF